jgi:ABC-type transporter Mla MlaB component
MSPPSRIAEPTDESDLPEESQKNEDLRRLHLEEDRRVLVCDLSQVREPDLGTIAALARLRASERAQGWSVRLRHASPRLQELLDLCGLAEILPECDESLPIVERQAEQGEQPRGVEEVVEPGDPSV